MKKLIILDLDGTLLDSEMKIPPGTREYLRGVREAGHVITIATGRTLVSTKTYARELGIDVPLAVLNGAWVTDIQGRDYYHQRIDHELVREFFDFCQEADITCSAVTTQELFINRPDQRAIEMHEFYEKMTPKVVVGPEELVGKSVLNLFLNSASREQMEETCTLLSERFEPRLQVVRVGGLMVDVLAPGVSKGSALCYLARYLGFATADCIAIGDNHNDIEMLRAAGTGVAMADADNKVREAADMVTLSNDEGGVVQALKQLL